jgi:hypothetical protein
MSRLIKSILAAGILTPGLALAAGYHVNGYVSIVPDSVMQANMSVRYNTTAAGTPYVYATGYAGSYVGFFGRDSNNQYFSCYVSTTNPIYAAAVDIKNNLQDGSRLYVTKNAGNSECTNVFLGNYSYYQE